MMVSEFVQKVVECPNESLYAKLRELYINEETERAITAVDPVRYLSKKSRGTTMQREHPTRCSFVGIAVISMMSHC